MLTNMIYGRLTPEEPYSGIAGYEWTFHGAIVLDNGTETMGAFEPCSGFSKL
jgi:hypothetical protein